MPVQTPNIEVSPYTSTVPTVQVPQMQLGGETPTQPLQGQFGGGRGSGKLAIGDSLLRGFLQGHEYKAQKKTAEAQATLAAGDAATQAAHQKYQDALVAASGNVDDPKAKAAYSAYTDVFTKVKAQKATLAIPQKPAKGEKSKEKKGAVAGMFGNVKEFMEANPHIVPQLALMTMQPQPEGMTPETKQAQLQQAKTQQALTEGNLEMVDTQRRQAAQKTYDLYSGLSEEQQAALPAEQQAAFRSARNVLYPPTTTGTTKLYDLADGTRAWLHPDNVPPGAQPVMPASASGVGKLGSESDYLERYAKQNNISTNQLTTADLDYVRAQRAYDTARSSQTSTTVRPGIDSTTTNSSRTAGTAPPPPRGRQGFGVEAAPAGGQPAPRGGMTPLPVAASPQPASTPRGGMTRPPAAGGGQISPTRARFTMQTNTEKQSRYEKIEHQKNAALMTNKKAYADNPEARQKADEEVMNQYRVGAQGIEDWYNQQVQAIGGTPGGKKKGPKTAGPVRYHQGHAYQQNPDTQEWVLQASAAQ